jgi:hypothetical protein
LLPHSQGAKHAQLEVGVQHSALAHYPMNATTISQRSLPVSQYISYAY